MVKGDNKYSQTIPVTLHFLQYHNRKTTNNSSHRGRQDGLLLAQREQDKDTENNKGSSTTKSNPCGKQKDGVYS